MFASYPRPQNDSKIGFHYYPDSRHFREEHLARWLPELKKLQISWLTLRASPREPVPATFLQGLREADIEPVVEIDHEQGFFLEKRALVQQAAHYARSGVRYISLLREPNLERNWGVQEWQRPNLVSRIMRAVLPAMETFVDAGLYPLLPPLYPGGDYSDLAFLASMLDIVSTKGSTGLVGRFGLCIHNYAFNRPITWGAGGQRKWSNIGPFGSLMGETPVGGFASEDHRGWRLWEWYDEIAQARVGHSLPMISGAGGALWKNQDQPDLPATTVEQHTRRNLELIEKMGRRGAPEFLLNQSFWLLAADADDPAHAHAWFKADGTTLPVVTHLQDTNLQSAAPKCARPAQPKAPQRPISHYLLLPSWEWGISSLHWEVVRGFVQAARPTVGFDVEEAQRAARVTLFVGAQGFGEETLEQLRAAGCAVEPIPAPDYATLQRSLENQATLVREKTE
jgi:hypothetical protein